MEKNEPVTFVCGSFLQERSVSLGEAGTIDNSTSWLNSSVVEEFTELWFIDGAHISGSIYSQFVPNAHHVLGIMLSALTIVTHLIVIITPFH